MEDFGTGKEEVYSEAVRAGKRTYFMDVKETKGGDRYITVTESKRHFDETTGRFVYEKHKIFLYREDFDNFRKGLDQAIRFVETGEYPERTEAEADRSSEWRDFAADFSETLG
ncbi:MAG: PUR family DNA/RNA-binding protein [Bacteroidales bacterium]|nr:PUR family DNA/RNA-binding protein [Bacteroidales bacterium]MDE5742741.1 PUR family DNA/RNA-binding protein [Bacteroidales bacterium]MDE6515160.1 PUR family DNA/RNA-binding protein [Bacteroidales bacterium]MDE7102972.1 PUR family DNA/RNA-binding protein [Bacteroidales bacterium]